MKGTHRVRVLRPRLEDDPRVAPADLHEPEPYVARDGSNPPLPQTPTNPLDVVPHGRRRHLPTGSSFGHKADFSGGIPVSALVRAGGGSAPGVVSSFLTWARAMPVAEELVEGVDREWLEQRARSDPVAHAWAIWDLDREPGRFRIVSLLRDGQTIGYLLVWYAGGAPRVHWVSSDPTDGMLALGLPLPPVIAIVPERVAAAVAERLHSTQSYPLDVLVCAGRTLTPPEPRVRRLRPSDLPALTELISRHPDPEMRGYANLDLDRASVWGAFESDRLAAVARIAVQLPAVWIITGVYTDPAFRGRGLGRAVTGAATDDALAAGARAALYVRADNAAAQTIYRELGFEPVDRRIWIDAAGPSDASGARPSLPPAK